MEAALRMSYAWNRGFGAVEKACELNIAADCFMNAAMSAV